MDHMDRRKKYSDADFTLRDSAIEEGVSVRTASRRYSVPRDEWLDCMAVQREKIRAMHDDRGFAWSDVGKAFGLSVSVVRQRAYRARRERAAGVPVPKLEPGSLSALQYDADALDDLMEQLATAHANLRADLRTMKRKHRDG